MILLEIDPNWVKPGWTPLIITVLLAAVLVLLFLSMRKQFGKINVPEDRAAEDQEIDRPRAHRD
jgi:hypothetical protein